MNTRTNWATNKDWVKATKNMHIAAYSQNTVNQTQSYTRDTFHDALQLASRPAKKQGDKRKTSE